MGEPFTHLLRVRYSECDYQGVVFNSHYLAYLDVSMTELWRVSFDGGYSAMVAKGIDMVVAEAALRFYAPARFDDELELTAEIERLGTTSLITRHRVARDGELLVEGDMRHVFVDLSTLTKTPIPEWARIGLARWAVEPSQGRTQPPG
jgi:acyl-CoA thioester hydrolase